MKIFLYSEQRFIAFVCAEIIRTAIQFFILHPPLPAGCFVIRKMLSQSGRNVNQLQQLHQLSLLRDAHLLIQSGTGNNRQPPEDILPVLLCFVTIYIQI